MKGGFKKVQRAVAKYIPRHSCADQERIVGMCCVAGRPTPQSFGGTAGNGGMDHRDDNRGFRRCAAEGSTLPLSAKYEGDGDPTW